MSALFPGRHGIAGDQAEAMGRRVPLGSLELGTARDGMTGFHVNFSQGKARLELTAKNAISLSPSEGRPEALLCLCEIAHRSANSGGNDGNLQVEHADFYLPSKFYGACKSFLGLPGFALR